MTQMKQCGTMPSKIALDRLIYDTVRVNKKQPKKTLVVKTLSDVNKGGGKTR